MMRKSVMFFAMASALAVLSLASGALAQSANPPHGALPLDPTRRLSFATSEATWMALDISPDGKTILFDLLGDIYARDMATGATRPLLTGQAFETQPVFSPDGRQIAFLSDRDGAANVWVANADGSAARRLSNDREPAIYSSPAWSSDGRTVYASRLIHSVLAFELFAYDAQAATGKRITNARPAGNERSDDRLNTIGAVASPDGRYLYYARKTGSLWSARPLPHWDIVRRTIASGVEDTIITSPGAAMRPALSRDGTKLVYASRSGAKTGLRLRDLVSGQDKWLSFPTDPDSQMGGYYNDLAPRIAFEPGDAAVLTAIDGHITRIALADGARTPIPFAANVDIPMGKAARVAIDDETGPVRVRVIQAPQLSPDGTRIAFAALGKLYVQKLGGGRPSLVGAVQGMAYQPAWAPDGRSLVYVTWTAREGGAVWTVSPNGGAPRQLTTDGAFYTEPQVSPDGRTIAVLRANHRERLNATSDVTPNRPTDILLLPVDGGPAKQLGSETGTRGLSFGGDGSRVRYLAGDALKSIGVSDGSVRTELTLTVRNPNRYFANAVPAQDARLSPDGKTLLVKAASQLWRVPVPPRVGDTPPRIQLATPSESATQLTDIGADYLGWSKDGAKILWSLGAVVRTINDGVAATLPAGVAEKRATRIEARVDLPRDVPTGVVVLRGATAITMRGDEVVENADVVIRDNRIVGVGPAGSIAVPRGAAIRDVRGKYIVPGFIDTHAHWFETPRQLLDATHWDYLANLAYGVTSGLDVQPFTIDALGYQDLIDAGLMVGPRAFSTGPGIFQNSNINSLAEARNVLIRYRDYYRTRNIKAYMVGNRIQRQYIAMAATELGMLLTTEGASDLNLDLTHALDGLGNEHNLPVSPLREDLVTLFAKSGTSYTPTLNVLYGGAPAFASMVIDGSLEEDTKLSHFMPPGVIEAKMRDRKWVPPFDIRYADYAADTLRIQRAGGLVGMGSHGTIQGLGYHFELQAYASGGASPHEVLRAATLGSAEVIGRKALLGSLEPGKYADLLILSADPLVTIGNTRSIDQVMKNGRLYDAKTLDEVWPRQRALPPLWFAEGGPQRPTGGRRGPQGDQNPNLTPR